MREIIKLGIFLLIVGALAGFGTSYVNSFTEPIIEARAQETKLASLKEVYPDAEQIKEETPKYIQKGTSPVIKQVFIAYKDGEKAGVIYGVEPWGYSGPISAMVGFDIADKKITNIKILSQTETPGLGAQCDEPWFAERFKGKTTFEPLKVVKKEPAGDNEIVAITASTITSKAVVEGVNIARAHFMEYYGR